LNHIVWRCSECGEDFIGGKKAGEHKLKTGHREIVKTSGRVKIE